MKKITYTLKGSGGLIMHNVESMLLERPRATKHVDWESSSEVFEARMYLSNEEKIEIPPRVIKKMLSLAAQKAWSVLGLKSGKSSYKQIIESMVFLNDGGLLINKNKDDCIKHESFVVVSSSKVLRVRPMVENWEGKLTLTVVNESQLPVAVLDEIITFGGAFLGLCDYRPEFGRFSVKKSSVQNV